MLTHFTHPTGFRAYSLLDYSFKVLPSSLLGAFVAVSAVLALPSVFALVPPSEKMGLVSIASIEEVG